jgi:hypothetical protein
VARAFYPEAVYVIVSLRNGAATGDAPEVRAFRIQDGQITEEELVEV